MVEGDRVTAVKNALARTKGNVSKAADKLGVSRQTLTVFISEHGKELGVKTTATCPNCGHSVPLRRRAGASRADMAAAATP